MRGLYMQSGIMQPGQTIDLNHHLVFGCSAMSGLISRMRHGEETAGWGNMVIDVNWACSD